MSNVCNEVEVHCLQGMKIMHHHANGCFDWLISGQQGGNPSREAISILSGKYKSFTLVHPVHIAWIAETQGRNSLIFETGVLVCLFGV